MNRAGWLVAAILAIAVAVLAYQLKSDQAKPTVAPAEYAHAGHAKAGAGEALEVWIDDLVLQQALPPKDAQALDLGVVVSVAEQQSVLWLSNKYEFKIIDLKPLGDAPKDKDPFYRKFSAETEKTDLWSKWVSSGPPRHETNPTLGKVFTYKATIKLRDGKVIDPHIMTLGGP